MNWSALYCNFLNGESSAVQAVFSVLGFTVTLLGTIYVAFTFHQQKKINRAQQILTNYSLEGHKREIRPNFKAKGLNLSGNYIEYSLTLTNALAKNLSFYGTTKEGTIVEAPRKHSYWETNDKPEHYKGFLTIEEYSGKLLVFKELQFQDEDGRLYIQYVKFRDQEVWTTFPEPKIEEKRTLFSKMLNINKLPH